MSSVESELESEFMPMRPSDPQVAGGRPPRINYTHEAMADLIIANPGISQNEIAARFGYTASWVSTVMTSDAFQAFYAKRCSEVIDPALMASVEHRFKAVCDRALNIVMEKLNKPSAEIPDQLALQSLQIAAKAAGFGARVELPPTNTTEVHVHLDNLAGNLTRLLKRGRDATDLGVGDTAPSLNNSLINAISQEPSDGQST